jgi:SAM-dependent methyltransferase
MNNTIKYYNQNADQFVQGTLSVDFAAKQERFLAKLSAGACILDFGCGSGRDTKYFLDKGYRVDAIDGSIELCKYASALTGIEVKQMFFEDFDVVEGYDAIWASASLLHCQYDALEGMFDRIYKALKAEGIFFSSFKYGDYQGYRSERYFTDLDEQEFMKFIAGKFEIVDQWISEDARKDVKQLWLNSIVRKK